MPPEWPQNAIAPGQSEKITIRFHTMGRPGGFTKVWCVTSNAKNNPDIVLTLKGFVKRQE